TVYKFYLSYPNYPLTLSYPIRHMASTLKISTTQEGWLVEVPTEDTSTTTAMKPGKPSWKDSFLSSIGLQRFNPTFTFSATSTDSTSSEGLPSYTTGSPSEPLSSGITPLRTVLLGPPRGLSENGRPSSTQLRVRSLLRLYILISSFSLQIQILVIMLRN